MEKIEFKVGAFDVRPLTGELTCDGETTRLEPKVMEVLVALAQQPGEVVERDELLRRVWGNRAAVSDEPLTRCIAELRRAFGDSRQAPTYIQTIPKRGYRLVCSVTPLGPSTAAATTATVTQPSGPAAPPPTVRDARRVAWLGVGVAASLGVIMAAWLPGGPREPIASGSAVLPLNLATNALAVLPFADSDQGDDNTLGEGIAEDILTRLGEVPGLTVIRRSSAFAPRAPGDTYQRIAARLGAANLVDGAVRRERDRVQVDVSLIDPQRETSIWSMQYDRALSELFALEDEIANALVAQLRHDAPAGRTTERIATPPPTRNLEAWYLFLRGRQALGRRDAKWVQTSIEFFERAVELDPEYGEAYVELAKAKVLLPSYEGFVLQRDSLDEAERILATRPALSRALDAKRQVVRALIAEAKHNWIEAGPALELAYQRAPNDSDLLVWYSEFVAATGHPDKALELAQRAWTLDSLSPVANHRLSVTLLWADRVDEAAKYLKRAEENGWNWRANIDSYVVLNLRQRDFEAVRQVLTFVERFSEVRWVEPFLAALASPDDAAMHALAVERLDTAGRTHDIPLKYLYGTWIYLHEADRAIDAALRLARNNGEEFKPEFLFSQEATVVRQSPRFGELVHALELDRYWDQFGWPTTMCNRTANDTITCH